MTGASGQGHVSDSISENGIVYYIAVAYAGS